MFGLCAVLLSAVLLRRPVRLDEVLAHLLTYAGLALVLWHSSDGDAARDDGALFGAALAMASSVCYATYLVGDGQVIARVRSLRFSACAMVAAAVACVLQFLLLRPMSALGLPMPVYGIVFVMAVLGTVIPVFFTAEALRHIGAKTVAVVGALGPVSTILLAWDCRLARQKFAVIPDMSTSTISRASSCTSTRRWLSASTSASTACSSSAS